MGICSGNSRKGSLSVTVLMGAVIILDAGNCQGEQMSIDLNILSQ